MFSKSTATASLALAALIPLVYAHGIVTKIDVGSTEHIGPSVGSGSPKANIQQVSSTSAITNVNDPNLACGWNAQVALESPTVAAGSTLDFYWGTGYGGNWFHLVGPVQTYMANCNGDCSKFDPTQGKWFKIDIKGYDTATGKWWQAAMATGAPLAATIPADLAPGQYLIRHEILALQNAIAAGGTEFYPSCSQWTVTGSGNAVPSNTISLPGGYSANDPGIVVPDIYNGIGPRYAAPGPAVYVAGSSPSVPSSSSSDVAPTPSSSSVAAPTSTTSTSTSTSTTPAAPTSTSSPTPAPSPIMSSTTPASSSSSSAPAPSSTSMPGGCSGRRRRMVKRVRASYPKRSGSGIPA